MAGVGLEFMFYRKDNTANTVTVNRASTNTIDGGTSFTLTGQYSSRSIEGDASGAWATKAQSVTASNQKQLQPLTATATGGVMTITLQPTTLEFRSTTLSNGASTSVSNASPITLTVPNTTSFGSATANGTQRLPVLAMNNGGAMELALGNMAGGVNLDETALVTTVAIGSATTAASLGSTTARSALAQRIVGYVDALFTTGTGWTISQVQPSGGNAITARRAAPP